MAHRTPLRDVFLPFFWPKLEGDRKKENAKERDEKRLKGSQVDLTDGPTNGRKERADTSNASLFISEPKK